MKIENNKIRKEIGCIFADTYNSSGMCTFNICADYTEKNEKRITDYMIRKYVTPYNGMYYNVRKFIYKNLKTEYLSNKKEED